MANQMGKRLVCDSCDGQVVVTKAGEGTVECCNAPMRVMDPKQLPKSD